MATLHQALQCLKPTTWDAVPQTPDDLRDYVREIFKDSRLVAESLPDPPPYENEENPPSSRVTPSSARVAETDPDITPLQKQWGKPIKIGGPKENPLGLHVWKLSANDGGGSWFGRRSVHEGMPYTRWQEKMSSEYDETLKVNRKKIEKGQTPDKSIRGIGAEEKVESIEVKDDDGSVLGQVMVYHVSAQFPKPTAPRDFVAMIVTSEVGLRVGGSKQAGRSWLMISKPCEHPDVPHKTGYTRGEYESVELIREVPRKREDSSSSNEDSKGCTEKSSKDDSGQEKHAQEEIHPVEWIMVTRSDPGGNIPRWMVDKGTPKSVGTDAAKFVEWATQDEESQKKSSEDSSQNSQNTTKSGETDSLSSDHEHSDSDSDSTEIDTHPHHGLIASVTGLLNTGFERYAPQAVSIHEAPISQSKQNNPLSDSEPAQPREPDQVSLSSAQSEGAIPGLEQNNLPPAELMQMAKASKLSSHEKELAKLALRKREIDAKLDTIRSELDKFHLTSQSNPGTPLKGAFDVGDSSDQSGIHKRPSDKRSSTPASSATQQSNEGQSSQTQTQPQTPQPELPAHMHKAASQLFNEEAKLLKQLRKVEGSQLKVASKIEAKQKKEADREEKSKSRSEVENLRNEMKEMKKEIGRLRGERQKWVDLVASLQAENTKLAARSERE
ncbi:hypothetical protein N7532_010568 [Penicillium argentinense]|uniref:DUF3074 domain-containing protein n=1 Tax=Penicillium argentinense TaxID=1131581 RepID=A0A9W9EPV2_9EURO|nr:uncharacterized protein N7532_010568 [Penicillium argentinense]KAJ5085797.1 hypothetical protein N7532_010568 [Penicillium argentinense]